MTSPSLEPHPPLDVLAAAGRASLFTDAHTVYRFSQGQVSDEQLAAIWGLAKWAPTSANTQPLRVTYLRTPQAQERLVPHLAEGNIPKVRSAGATALLVADLRFHEHIPRLMPLRPEYREAFEADEQSRLDHARFNATVQAGYFILAVRAVGLAAGPFTGFDHAAVETEFFPGGQYAVLMGVNIGVPHPEGASIPRLPRLEDDEVLTWL
jgi:3-hydroxypropanoate dehydrogenase